MVAPQRRLTDRLSSPRLASLLRLGLIAALVAACLFPSLAALAEDMRITGARVWPATEYTRVTLESGLPLKHSLTTVKNPERLVIDIENVSPSPELDLLAAKISADDPYIKSVRVGRYKPEVLRIVLDLKAEVQPQLFTLKPIADYGYRLVLDLYPVNAPDPLMALVMKSERAQEAAAKSADAALEPSAQPVATVPGLVLKSHDEAVQQERERKSISAASAKKSKAMPGRTVTIAVDAGHGGEDPGARGRRGAYEKDITLAIARKLKAKLDDAPGMRGMLTRDGDYFIPLQMRVHKARKVQADLFVSIHADAFIHPHARGSSVFALSERGATSAAAGWLAKRENEADLIGGVNIDVSDVYLKKTLLDLQQTATINDSLKLARAVLGEVGAINTLHKGDVEQAGFAVLKAPDIPSILVETAFISNPDEEKRLKNDAYQDKMADAILQGIKRYFAQNPPLARTPRLVEFNTGATRKD